MATTHDRQATALRVIGWLVERHHQSLGLWPWTWTGPAGEPYVTLYASCTSARFGDDFGALSGWIDASVWPPLDGTPHPATFYRDRLRLPDWSLQPPTATPAAARRATHPELDVLADAGATVETIAQLQESASNLDLYLAMLAPLRHGGHRHRQPAGRMAVQVMHLATEAALALGQDYAIPWTGPAAGHATGIVDADWTAFRTQYRLDEIPFQRAPQDVFAFGDRGWLHAAGWAGDRYGNVVRLRDTGYDTDAVTHQRAMILRLLGG
jgi:hypothetical protein